MTEAQRLYTVRQRLERVRKDLESSDPELPNRLNEKGVECAILVPLFEDVLGYDPITDIEYESTSTQNHGQRFDFLLDHRLLVETKSLTTQLSDRAIAQISEYIGLNDEISFGIATNGVEYALLMERHFIEKKANQGEPIVGAVKNVYHIFTIDSGEEKFYEIMDLFNRTSYEQSMVAVAKYVLRQLVPSKGPHAYIFRDRELDQRIKDKIEKQMDFSQGVYLQQIRSGELKPSQELFFSDEYVKVTVILEADGSVTLPKGGIEVDANKILTDRKYLPLLEKLTDWHSQEQRFKDPRDILREASGKKRIPSAHVFQLKG